MIKKEEALLSKEQKKARFTEFYLISHPISANLLCDKDNHLMLKGQSMDEFEASMPYAFRIAGEMAEIQSQSLKPLRGLGEKLTDLLDYLKFQAKKIDLMMSYILQQQDDPNNRVSAIKFGGGGVVIETTQEIELGETCIVKLFLETESTAVYCYAEAIEFVELDGRNQISFLFTHIRDTDQELLVRASLHLQTAALRKQQNKAD